MSWLAIPMPHSDTRGHRNVLQPTFGVEQNRGKIGDSERIVLAAHEHDSRVARPVLRGIEREPLAFELVVAAGDALLSFGEFKCHQACLDTRLLQVLARVAFNFAT